MKVFWHYSQPLKILNNRERKMPKLQMLIDNNFLRNFACSLLSHFTQNSNDKTID